MSTRRVSAVILAGGRSSRFGRDKLAEPLDGRPMLDHVIEAVRLLATEILVVAAPDSNPRLPQGATLVHDPVAFEGPLAGVLVGLGAARESIVLVVGGDMPALVGAVIESMLQALDALEKPETEAVVLEHDGRGRPLPLVLRREPALAAAQGLFTAGERRLRALPGALATATIPEPAWRTLDRGGHTLRDIDTEEDLPAR
jgi:molybdopterin-guanine dinucleotide biosynthesis protein A